MRLVEGREGLIGKLRERRRRRKGRKEGEGLRVEEQLPGRRGGQRVRSFEARSSRILAFGRGIEGVP